MKYRRYVVTMRDPMVHGENDPGHAMVRLADIPSAADMLARFMRASGRKLEDFDIVDSATGRCVSFVLPER